MSNVPGRPSWSPEPGYRAWLRHEPLLNPALAGPFREMGARVVVGGWSEVMERAAQELAGGLGLVLGRRALVHGPGELGRRLLGPGPPRVVLGTSGHPELAEEVERAGLGPVPAEGFALLPGTHQGGSAGRRPGTTDLGLPGSLAIVGGSDVGCLYGAFGLLRRVSTGGAPPTHAVVDAPAAPVRMLQHWDNLDGTVERGYAGGSVFFQGGEVTRDLARLRDYARLLASVGVNSVCVNNVNVDAAAMALLTPRHLGGLAAVARVMRPYGVRLWVSAGFTAPMVVGGLATADPADDQAQLWWESAVALAYEHIPDLGGFVVKAGSESRPGPQAYGRSHAEGANMLARALAPYGGALSWRCFVYDCGQDWRDTSTDRAKAAFDEFSPLDGCFDANVFLQVKSGPMDFQVREPPSPLLGAMPGTAKFLEVQLTQEYTGQRDHTFYLVPAWSEVLNFATGAGRRPSLVSDLVLRGGQAQADEPTGGSGRTPAGRAGGGMVGVANVGTSPWWTGALLAQANLYGFGRLAWSPALAPSIVAEEWSRLTFGLDADVTGTVTSMLMASPAAYEAYTSPLGLGWLVTPGTHGGPAPEGYEYSRWGTYHRADHRAVGVDRARATGTGFTAQYHEPWASTFDDPARCPQELLLFFHRLPYTYRLASGRALVQYIYDSHFEGVEEVERWLGRWRALEGKVDVVRHRAVERCLLAQLEGAREWRDVVTAYFHRRSGIPDEKGRTLY